MPIRVGSVQFAPKKAQVGANLDRIAGVIRDSQAEAIDLLVFPEGGVTGYFLEGGVYENALTAETLRQELQTRLTDSERQIDIVIGFYELGDMQLYNSAAYLTLAQGQVTLLHVYRKFFLPTYGVFDEERFVTRGRELGVFDTRFGRVGLLICEDVWHSVLPSLTAMAGANLFLVPSASPARGFNADRPENHERYERLLRGISEEHSVFCINAMLCGFEGGKGLTGGSMVVDPMGKLIAAAPIQEEHVLMVDIDIDLVSIARAQSPLLGDLKSNWSDVVRLAEGLLR